MLSIGHEDDLGRNGVTPSGLRGVMPFFGPLFGSLEVMGFLINGLLVEAFGVQELPLSQMKVGTSGTLAEVATSVRDKEAVVSPAFRWTPGVWTITV